MAKSLTLRPAPLSPGEAETFRSLDLSIQEYSQRLGAAWVEREDFAKRLWERYGPKRSYTIDGVTYQICIKGDAVWFMKINLPKSERAPEAKKKRKIKIPGSRLSYTHLTIDVPVPDETPEMEVPLSIMVTPAKQAYLQAARAQADEGSESEGSGSSNPRPTKLPST